MNPFKTSGPKNRAKKNSPKKLSAEAAVTSRRRGPQKNPGKRKRDYEGVPYEARGEGRDQPPYWCPTHKRLLKSHKAYLSHSLYYETLKPNTKESKKQFQCQQCDKTYWYNSGLRQHISRKHGPNCKTQFFCSIGCGKTLKTHEGLRRHIKQCLGEKVIANVDKKFSKPVETYRKTDHLNDEQQVILNKLLERYQAVVAKHRGLKRYSVYAVMDPRLLPEALKEFIVGTIGNDTSFGDYCTAKVYIGKGTNNRRYDHYKIYDDYGNDDQLEVTDMIEKHLNEN